MKKILVVFIIISVIAIACAGAYAYGFRNEENRRMKLYENKLAVLAAANNARSIGLIDGTATSKAAGCWYSGPAITRAALDRIGIYGHDSYEKRTVYNGEDGLSVTIIEKDGKTWIYGVY